jgi:hypothetical protein
MRPLCSVPFATCAFVATVDLAAAVAEGPRQAEPDPGSGIVEIFQIAVAFVAAVTRSAGDGEATAALIRLLVIVEVLIAALGFVCCVTVWGRGKAALVFRIVDVMGSLFLIIAMMIAGLAMV